MTFNTGNPIGSTDPRDLSDNSENLDRAVNNAASATWTDRFGKSRTSLSGQIGYIGTGTNGAIENYASGQVLSTYNTIIRYNSEFYRPSASATLPYTTTATLPDVDANLVAIGDANLRQDLASNVAGSGSDDVAHTGTTDTVTEAINQRTIYVGSVADLEAFPSPINGQEALVLGVPFKYSGTAWEPSQEYVTPEIYGAAGDGVADDSDAIENCVNSGMNVLGSRGKSYKITRGIAVNNISNVFIDFNFASIVQSVTNLNAFVLGQSSKLENIKIKNGRFIGAEDGNGASSAISFASQGIDDIENNGSRNIEISGNYFSGWTISCAGTGVFNFTFKGNTSTNTYFKETVDTAGGYGILLQSCYKIDVSDNLFIASLNSDPTITDRHAVYISVDPSQPDSDKNRCKDILVSNNIIDWKNKRLFTGSEQAITTRSVRDFVCTGNSIIGSGISCNTVNGDAENIIIEDNIFSDVDIGGSGNFAAIHLLGNTTKSKNVVIRGNTITWAATSGGSSGVQVSGVVGGDISGNVITAPALTDMASGVYLLADNSAVILGTNTINNESGGSGVWLTGNANDNLIIKQQLFNADIAFRFRYFSGAPSNVKYDYTRAGRIASTGTGGATINNVYDSPITSAEARTDGFKVFFRDDFDVESARYSVSWQSSSIAAWHVRLTSVAENSIIIGLSAFSGGLIDTTGQSITLNFGFYG